MKKISVIIPLYTLSPDVKRAVSSVSRQSIAQDVEVLLLDLRRFVPTEEGDNEPVCEDVKEYLSPYLKFPDNFRILSCDSFSPYDGYNQAISQCSGTYLLFLASNCVLASDILKKLYETAEEKQADMLIGCWMNQKGKEIEQNDILEQAFASDFDKNFAKELSVIPKNLNLYNKFFKTSCIFEGQAAFSSYNTPKNLTFLTACFVQAERIFLIEETIYLRDFRGIYEHPFPRDLSFWQDDADALQKVLELTSETPNKDFGKVLVKKHLNSLLTAIPTVKGRKGRDELREKSITIYKIIKKRKIAKPHLTKLEEEFPFLRKVSVKKQPLFKRVKRKVKKWIS